MKKRTTIRVISFLSAAVVAAGVLAVTGQRRARALELYARANTQQAFDELVSGVSELSQTLEKSVYITDPALEGALCTQIFARAAAAQTAMGRLPWSSEKLDKTAAFLSVAGDYACTLARTVGSNGGYSEEELKNLTELADTAGVMAMDLRDMQAGLMEGRLRMDEVYAAGEAADAAEEEAGITGVAAAFRSVEEEFPELPTLIYDGPFSDAVQSAEPKYLQGMPEADEADMRKAAADFLGTEADRLTDLGEVGGRLPSRCYAGIVGGAEYTVMVSKRGGLVYSALCSRIPGTERLRVENGVSIARDFLESQGYRDMEETYHMAEGGVLTVNFAYNAGGVRCYPDMVKVGVALDNGSIMNWDARGYLFSHVDRTWEEPEISEEEALETVSPLLTPGTVSLALIPAEGGEERLCREIVCEASDGQKFLLYVNAFTGAQERILILLEDENGALTV